MKTTYLYTIKADDAPGILNQILAIFNRRKYSIESVTASKTGEISEVVIVVESKLESLQTVQMQRQIEKIIEVSSVNVTAKVDAVYQKVSFWKMGKEILATPQAWVIEKYKAQIINIDRNSILISKCGNDEELNDLSEKLGEAYLLGYAETGVICEHALENDDEGRISRLAA